MLDYYKKYPWKRKLVLIKQRCENPKDNSYKNYGGRGIKCLITENELKELWFRDKAYLMKKPSIGRKNHNKSYYFDNCKFEEQSSNCAERCVRILSKIVLQYDLEGNFIKEWQSATVAAKEINLHPTSIRHCVQGKTKSSGGYIWKSQISYK